MPTGDLKPRLQEKYTKEIVPKMRQIFAYKNDLAVPKLVMIKVNAGISTKNSKDEKFAENVASTLAKITGQKPIMVKAKKSISAFKVRKGMIVSSTVTLRGRRMYEFFDKLINITLARVRDFRGLEAKSMGNSRSLTIGFKENVVFPEIKSDEVERIHGLEVTILTNAENGKEAFTLLKLMGVPFKEEELK